LLYKTPEFYTQMFEINLDRSSEMTIIIQGNEKIWDVGIRDLKYFWD